MENFYKKFLLTFQRRKKPDFDSIFYLQMLERHKMSVAHDLTDVQLLIQKLNVLLKSLFMNISRNVATIRLISYMRFPILWFEGIN